MARTAVLALFRLSQFYESDTQLAKALDWSNDTVRAWRRRAVVRPRAGHIASVHALLRLCRACEPWVTDRKLVGTWTIEPNEALRGAQPASFVRELGATGVDELIAIMPRIAPKTRVQEPVEFSADQLQAILSAAAEISAPLPPAAEAELDLSDLG